MKRVFMGFVSCLICQCCYGQQDRGLEFLDKYYVVSKEYNVWDDTVHSSESSETEVRNTDHYYFFRSKSPVETKDSLKITIIMEHVHKMESLATGKEEIVFSSCNPYFEMAKSKRDTCWRGLYVSEGTGYCQAVMTVKTDSIRIAGVSTHRPFTFFALYRRVEPTADVVSAVKEYLGN